ncbi:hypothetical protein Q8A73_002468 [Channa argus]|nr:hypothetical protein Q8A73_002468 [Channa argus]
MRRVHSPSYLSFVIINAVLNVEISDERREGGRELRITDTQEGVCRKQADALLFSRIMSRVTGSDLLVHAAALQGFVKAHKGSQGNPANGACASMRRSLSSGPCVVWLYAYVCGLPGPLLICPRPANGLPIDHGCLLYFCLHQLNSDHPLPPAGPNQAPAPALSSPWKGPRVSDKTGHWVLVD